LTLSATALAPSLSVVYAGFWRRLVAHILDLAILNGVSWVFELVILQGMYAVYSWLASRHGAAVAAFDDAFDPLMYQVVSAVIYLILITPYYIWGQFRYGTTLGKSLMGIVIVSYPSHSSVTLRQSTLRFCSYLASYLPLGCGFMMAAFHPEKRALHDLIAGTAAVVRRKAKVPSAVVLAGCLAGISLIAPWSSYAANAPKLDDAPKLDEVLQIEEASSLDFQANGAFILGKPSAVGGEAGFSLLFHPLAEHELVVGPRANVLLAHAGPGPRFELLSGVEGTVWLVNAIGPGFAVDLAAPTSLTGEDVPVHIRFSPLLSIRVARQGDDGAWSVRFGFPYDTHFRWGFQAGVTLQFNGVPGFIL
jgi:uncharacterized RDD family membrane protein YckC